jgi:hypothetical protein
MDILEKHIVHQQEELIKMQILLYALVDELIEQEVIDDTSLDNRIKEKISIVNSTIQSQLKELDLDGVNLSKIFNGPMGEA